MAKIIQFNKSAKKDVKPRSAKRVKQALTLDPFFQMVEEDVENLMQATGKDREGAIKMASDFFRRYPALTSWVASPEYEAER